MKTLRTLAVLISMGCLAQATQAVIIPVGAGNISDTINTASWGCVQDHGNWIFSAGVVLPVVADCDVSVTPAKPIGTPTYLAPKKVAPADTQPTMTHRWWGSVSFMGAMKVDNPDYMAYITPDPLMAHIHNKGVRIMGMPGSFKVDTDGYLKNSKRDLPTPTSEVFDGISVGNSDYGDLDAFLKSYSDGSVTVQWKSGSTPVMEATFVHNSTYVYFKVLAGKMVIKTKSADSPEKGTFATGAANSLGLWAEVAGNRSNFLVVGAGTTTFDNVTSNQITVNSSSQGITLAYLPQAIGMPSTAMINDFLQYAAQPVDEVLIDYTVDRSNNSVKVTHKYKYNGNQVTTLAGMAPLQWKNSTQTVGTYSVRSARGVTKFAAMNGFEYTMPFTGVLPYLPENVGAYDPVKLRLLVNEYLTKDPSTWNERWDGDKQKYVPVFDTYWSGKNYGKIAELAAIARSNGMTTEADKLTNWLKSELEDWFHADTTGNLDTNKYFVYDRNWNTLLGLEESFSAHQLLNDHHFHYGYFVRAAAEVCRVDPSWCSSTKYGPMVEMLIRDYAAARNDSQFPYLRNFDPANGFSWASGQVNFARGNNNESTSEAANAYGAMVLYGQVTGNQDITNRGIYLHTSTVQAFWQYWNNIDRYKGLTGDYDNFISDYPYMTTSIIWGDGHHFATWFSARYAHILGIQGLPLNPLVLHLGLYPNYLKDYAQLGLTQSSNKKPSGLDAGDWPDVWWNIYAMAEGANAVNDLNTAGFNYRPEDGETKAHTYHWVNTMAKLGNLKTGLGTLTANSPAAVAFDNAGQTSYVAYNFNCTPLDVQYSDGTSLTIPSAGFGIKRTGTAMEFKGSGCGSSSSAASSSSSRSSSVSSLSSSSLSSQVASQTSLSSTFSSVSSSKSSTSSASSVSSAANGLGVINIVAISGGGAKFSIRLPERKNHVHVFARRNGVQDFEAIDLQSQSSGETNNGDGTFTYSATRTTGYTNGDALEVRFYTATSSGQTFYPGPQETTWTSAVYQSSSLSSSSLSSVSSSQSSSSAPASSSSSKVSSSQATSVSSSSSSSAASSQVAGYSASATMPNGVNLSYTTTATYSNNTVHITITAGQKLNWAWCYTPGWSEMHRLSDYSFDVTIPNVTPGQQQSYYFTVSTATGEANNASSPHQWLVK